MNARDNFFSPYALFSKNTLIINQSITMGNFPENFKIAKVVPIYKKDDQSQIKSLYQFYL